MAPTPQQGTDDTLGAPGGHADTSNALMANLVCRILLAVIANLICLVPLRILWRNGEFAAAVFIITVILLNIDTIIMALVWRNDDVASWWPGYGLCDAHNYYFIALTCLYASSNMAIMRNLSHQVGLLRASPLSRKERRIRNFIQGLIMFPVPILQMAWVYPLSASRYLIGTLVGCAYRADRSWPTIVFFHLPNPLFALGSAYYAGMSMACVQNLKRCRLTSYRRSYLHPIQEDQEDGGCGLEFQVHVRLGRDFEIQSRPEEALPHGPVHPDTISTHNHGFPSP
jgi:hypothetical protein